MVSQVVKFAFDSSAKPHLDEILEQWIQGPGKRLDGCEDVTVSYENGVNSRVSVVVAFRDQASLDRFSQDRESLELFERVKPLIKDSLQIFEASMQRTQLV